MSWSNNGRSRRAELDAAFDSDADAAELPSAITSSSLVDLTGNSSSRDVPDGPPGYDTAVAHNSSSNGGGAGEQRDVFFDAGDALGEEPPAPANQPRRPHTAMSDPLGASGRRDGDDDDDDEDDERAESAPLQQSSFTSRSATAGPSSGYDFERATYFNTSRSRSASTSGMHSPSNAGLAGGHTPGGTGASSAAASAGHGASAHGLDRARQLLGRFGRFVGMRVPGAAYSTLAQEDGGNGASGSSQRPRRVMGGGLGQDGVFGNLNAKPESRRRRGGRSGDPNDRGEDDDLEEEILPPTYEVAAADAAPGYWETTIAPGGMGWTPGGGHVGDVEDLILEGLPIGNFFGFAWNLLVSMCFQFVGFLLTYLLHTTHAARCGSRAGLGITLIQYGFYLRTRALQLADDGGAGVGAGAGNGGSDGLGGIIDNGTSPGIAAAGGVGAEMHTLTWWGATIVYPVSPSPTSSLSLRDFAQPSSALYAAGASATSSAAGAMPTGGESNLASAFASEGDGLPANTDASITDTSEWLSYALMVIGWFILLTSLLSYWRVHRWGRALVAASRREQESARAAENGGQAPEVDEGLNAPVGFIHRLRAIINQQQQLQRAAAAGRETGTGEDWIIFPGMSAGGNRAERGSGSSGGTETTTTTATTAARTHASRPSSGGSSISSGHGMTVWGAAPRPGTLAFPVHDNQHPTGRSRPRRDDDVDVDDSDDEDELAALTSSAAAAHHAHGSESHLSPEERRMMSGLRGAGFT